jgi:hypothetical protein
MMMVRIGKHTINWDNVLWTTHDRGKIVLNFGGTAKLEFEGDSPEGMEVKEFLATHALGAPPYPPSPRKADPAAAGLPAPRD